MQGQLMIRCMSKSLAAFIIAIYNDPSDPRSPARIAQRTQRAKVGKELAWQALASAEEQQHHTRDHATTAVDALFRTVSGAEWVEGEGEGRGRGCSECESVSAYALHELISGTASVTA
jgi:hypothetical protein